MNKTITARPAGVRAYSAGIVRLKLFLQADDLRMLGVETEKGGLVTAVLQAFEWDAWREDPTSFPKVFGTVSFEADGAKHMHLDADADHEEARDWYELVGFCPAGESTGRGLYPDFETLLKSSGKKQESVKGF